MFKVTSLYGFMGVSLFLVALYVVLEHGSAASSVIESAGKSYGGILSVLQGNKQ
jgi:hypothetical protein